MPKQAASEGLDDVQVLGVWNFTLQSDTPLYWLRCGALEKYLLKFKIRMPMPATAGIVLHAEVDGLGTDGASFWIERRDRGGQNTKRYLMSGEGLESKAIVTRSFPDDGGVLEEEIEVLMQGYSGTIFLQNRAVKINFKCKQGKGSIAFYNSTQGAEEDDVTFSGVRITAMRRGPMEIGGVLGRREISLNFQQSGHDKDVARSTMGAMGATASTQGGTSYARGFGATATSPATVGRQPSRSMTGGWGAATAPAPKARLRGSASEGTLRRAGGNSMISAASMTVGTGGKRGWRAMELAPATSEQAMLKAATQRARPPNACNDFIAM